MLNYLSEKFKVRKSILYLLLVVILFSAYNLLIKKEIDHIQGTKEQIIEMESKLSLINKKIAGVNGQRLLEMEERTTALQNKYDFGLESQLVLLDINQYAKESGLDIYSFKALDITEFKDFKQRNYSLKFMGDFDKFLHWLRLMEDTPYYITIGDLHVTKERTSRLRQELVFEVTINNIAIDGNLFWEENDPEKFRQDPFEPGIGYPN